MQINTLTKYSVFQSVWQQIHMCTVLYTINQIKCVRHVRHTKEMVSWVWGGWSSSSGSSPPSKPVSPAFTSSSLLQALHHGGQCEITPSWWFTHCKTCKQNFTLVHYYNKLSVKHVEIKCTVQYTCNLTFMSNVSNTYLESHVFWVSVGAWGV